MTPQNPDADAEPGREERRQREREAPRRYREAHADQMREYKRAWRERNAAHIREYRAAYDAEHPAERRAEARRYAEKKQRERRRKKARQASSKKYYEANKAEHHEYTRQWRLRKLAEDPDGYRAARAKLQEEFGERNMYFNTFGGNPVSAAAGRAVLDVIRDEGLQARSADLGACLRDRVGEITRMHDRLGPVKGEGLFFGFAVFDRPSVDPEAQADPAATKLLVEAVKARGVLLSRIGRHDSVVKTRPPLAIQESDVPVLVDALEGAVAEVFGG